MKMNLEGQSKGNLQVYRKKGIVFLSVPLARRFFHGSEEGQCCVKFMELCLKERITRKKKLLSCFQFKLLQL